MNNASFLYAAGQSARSPSTPYPRPSPEDPNVVPIGSFSKANMPPEHRPSIYSVWKPVQKPMPMPMQMDVPGSIISDEQLKRDYWRPLDAYYGPEGYRERVQRTWEQYLEEKNFKPSFTPLQGTEQERYSGIVETQAKTDTRLFRLRKLLERAEKQMARLRLTPSEDNPNPERLKRGGPRKRPIRVNAEMNIEAQELESVPVAQEELSPRIQQLLEDEKAVKAAIKDLKKHMAGLEAGTIVDPRHERQRHPECHGWAFNSDYGHLRPYQDLRREHWFMGHRPGDPIFRIIQNATLPAGEDPFYLGEPFFNFRFEGIVPFGYHESRERLEKFALPAFLTMIIAIVAFDPVAPTTRKHPSFIEQHLLAVLQRQRDTDDDQEREQPGLGVEDMALLRRVWEAKFDEHYAFELPSVLRVQAEGVTCRIAEVAWLFSKMRPNLRRFERVRDGCEFFMRAMTGKDMRSLSLWYMVVKLKQEAITVLKDAQEAVDDVFFYRRDHDPIKPVSFFLVFVTPLLSLSLFHSLYSFLF
ncbi:hypothetical protein F4778DRAFT_733953 [Xylariomycetidae sp. FL2044]|nr:hypothetical protein F4778DRAFT_733953 [Xylariomycetidae sp. FL2044]